MKSNRNLIPWAKQVLITAVALLLITYLPTSQACTSHSEIDQPSSVAIVAVGDTNGYNILPSGENQDDPLQGIKGLLGDQEIFIFNFEGVLLSEDSPTDTCHQFPRQSLFQSSPRIADFLHPTNYTIATLANNHILDCGSCGIQETINELTSRGILTVGAGENSQSACQPIRLQVNGISLVVTSYLAIEPNPFSAGPDTAGAATWEECSGQGQLADLAATGDVVIAALHLHLGDGWTDQPPPEHITLIQDVLDAGADIVIAHGPHVPQGIMVRDGQIALLSLGNFLFRPDYQMPEEAHQTIMAKVTISPDSLSLALLPLIVDDSGRPMVPPPKEASQILCHIADLSAELGTTIKIQEQTGYITVPRQTHS
jgi:poly-gamma-glutamate synthesis protein (capsule biosynthesis protein)